MALSEEEQKLLAQLEASLAAEDPKLASALRGSGERRLHRRHATLAGLAFVAGLAALVGGMQVHPAVSVVGFLFMLVGAVVGIYAWQHVAGDDEGDEASGKEKKHPSGANSSRDFMDKMEERWRRRQEEGN